MQFSSAEPRSNGGSEDAARATQNDERTNASEVGAAMQANDDQLTANATQEGHIPRSEVGEDENEHASAEGERTPSRASSDVEVPIEVLPDDEGPPLVLSSDASLHVIETLVPENEMATRQLAFDQPSPRPEGNCDGDGSEPNSLVPAAEPRGMSPRAPVVLDVSGGDSESTLHVHGFSNDAERATPTGVVGPIDVDADEKHLQQEVEDAAPGVAN